MASKADGVRPGEAVNEVVLVGRLSAEPEERELPSGDVLTTFRLVVDRPPQPAREGVRPTTVDTLDCVVWTPSLRRAVGGWSPGDVVRVEGSLRRRFWRGGAGPVSRHEVEVARAKRLQRAS